jgi:hypothetical protein
MPDPSVVQTSPEGVWSSGASFTMAFSAGTTGGDRVFPIIDLDNYQVATIQVSSITDDASPSNTYAKVCGGVNGDFIGGEIWQQTNAQPKTCQTLTVNLSVTPTAATFGRAVEVANAGLVDKYNFSTVETTSLNSGSSGALTAAGELALGAIFTGDAGGSVLSGLTYTQGAPSTALPSATSVTAQGANYCYLTITTTTAQTLSATYTSGIVAFFCGLIVIKAVPTAPGQGNFLPFT